MEQKNSNFTAELLKSYVVTTSGADITVTLPTATGKKPCSITFVVQGSENAILTPQTGQTINGNATYTVTSQAVIQSDGSNYYVISN